MRAALFGTVVLVIISGGICWAQADLIFADDFETGDVSQWSRAVA